ncbi:UbiA family prenyltransferase [Teichococcus wenyumeiae]|uniref:UbiA family prenyltransferase n=1 Tax=Teichococcus wenyumeiae TaxID=2478470 RepID=UPI0013145D63|nr:UbiA family prenyltransferase [Pseudoroseomonas wenyumeiae]
MLHHAAADAPIDVAPQDLRNITPASPLCVDLDGTLTPSDTLVEGVLALLGSRHLFWALHGLLKGGRALLKQRVAEVSLMDATLLPYNTNLLTYLQEQKRRGRRLVLVTAADASVARSVAEHHAGLFDEVLASDGSLNLKGEAKAQALVERFGAKQFVYIGNDATDVAIWRVAQAGILVNASRRTAAAARLATKVEAEFRREAPIPMALLRAMRPHQWAKNVLVIVPVFTAHAATDLSNWISALITFVAFCATASGIYLFNDLTDLAADRRHPRKRMRPFASGAVPLTAGFLAGAALLCTGLLLAALAGALLVLLLYAVLSLAYSMKLKELPLVDVFVLAALYTVRIVAGGEATGHTISLWLICFSSFLFLSLALVKRVEELQSAAGQGKSSISRRGYTPEDAPILRGFGCASSFAASLVLALFVQSEALQQQHYASPALLWAVVPLVLFWQCRLWLSAARGYMHDDPIIYAARDWVSWVVALCVFIVLMAAKSVSWFGS